MIRLWPRVGLNAHTDILATTKLILQQSRTPPATMKCESHLVPIAGVFPANVHASSPQSRPCGHHHTWEVRRQKGSYSNDHSTRLARFVVCADPRSTRLISASIGRHYPASRYRLEIPPIPPRSCRRHRTLPFPNHPPHVEEASREAIKGQALYQDH